jgi:spermidine synthase
MNTLSPPRDIRLLALALMVSSGGAALGFEIVWTQQAALWFGHESAAVLAVVAAFFGGLALGALALGRRVQQSRAPARWFAACEAAIGAWGLVLALLLEPVTRGLVAIVGAQPAPAWHWAVAFGGTFVLLLPATAAMGATLPAMERALARTQPGGTSIAALYAGNTAGAVLGVLAAAFWLVPTFGLTVTATACAALNLVAATAALRVFAVPSDAPVEPVRATPALGLLPLLAATGLLGIGYEVLVVRVLSQVTENTVYTFALLLAVYLVGTALGAAAYGRWLGRSAAHGPVRDALLCALAAACLVGTLALALAAPIRDGVLRALGAHMSAALAAETALAALGFLLPTIAMGALFSHLAATAGSAGVSLGRVLGVNTLGAAAAPWLFGVVLLPALGTKLALLLVAAGYLALVSARAWRAPMQWATAAFAAVLFVWAPAPTRVDVPPGGRIVSLTEGALATVSIVEANGVASLHINNRQQEGSNATVLADARQALLPLLLHAAPRRALFLGLGTGVTAASAAQDLELRVDAVELLPEVIAASGFFTREVFGSTPNPRLTVIAADARRFVRATAERYDVIVADNFHPARSGSGALYTVEHFRAVRERLAAGGLFCQWLPLHQLDLDTLRSIVRTFLAVYPKGAALLATNSLETPVVGLIGQRDATGFAVDTVRERIASSRLPPSAAELGLGDELAVLGSFIAGPGALASFAGDAPLNTDDLPVVAYLAPRITYAADSAPRARLLALLHAVHVTPAEILAAGDPGTRLTAYWAARDRFIEAGYTVRATNDVVAMLAQVREPLLSVLRVSPDFGPAYDPLLRMAGELGRSDAAAARALLGDLVSVQPARPEAAEALRRIGAP